jgi:hypothetical protein
MIRRFFLPQALRGGTPRKKAPLFAFPAGAIVLVLMCYSLALGYVIFKPRETASVKPRPTGWVLAPERAGVFHDEWVDFSLTPPPASAAFRPLKDVTAWVSRGTAPVTTIGELERVTLRYDRSAALWRGRWPVPWNAPDGNYQLNVDTTALPAGAKIDAQTFQVASRAFEPLPAGFGVLTLEGFYPLDRIPGPDGKASLGALGDWARFIGADAVFIQGAESSGHTVKLPKENPWQSRTDGTLRAFGQELHRRGLKLGVYLLSFMVGGPPKYSPDYTYGWHFEKGKPVHGLDLPVRRGVSITDPKRPDDIVKVLKRWQANEGVDFLGLDYIRPVFGSYELVNDFVAEMPGVRPPENWKTMTPSQRMSWIARGRYLAPNPSLRREPKYQLTDQWFWYRAHRTARVVRRITNALGDQKPLWGFTLSWQKGWEHGQDPIMMRDAGLDIDAIMLYEADGVQYRNLVGQWNSYTRRDQLNLMVGNTYDWPLHQKTLNPSGPEEFYRRQMLAVERFHSDAPVRAVFTHDFQRGWRGRLGPYGSREWLLVGGASMTRLRQIHGRLPYDLSLTAPASTVPGATQNAVLAFTKPAKGAVKVQLYSSSDLHVTPTEVRLTPEEPSATVRLRWNPDGRSAARGNRAFLGARAESGDTSAHCQIYYHYIQGRFGGEPPVAQKAEEKTRP